MSFSTKKYNFAFLKQQQSKHIDLCQKLEER